MKIVYNKIIPFKGFLAMNLFGIIFAREEYKPLSQKTINHESIHTAQIKELLYVGFYIIYLFEWLYRLPKQWVSNKNAYRNISFEREAYAHQYDEDYLPHRKLFAQWRK